MNVITPTGMVIKKNVAQWEVWSNVTCLDVTANVER